MADAQQEKFLLMTTKPVSFLISKMAVPGIISVLITQLYNTADTFFVSRIDTQATAAVGVVFSYMALIQALAFFFGQGSALYMSRALGHHDPKSAATISAAGFFTALIFGLSIMTIGLIFLDPLLYLLGSTETILPQAEKYLRWILVGTPFIMTSLVMNNQMRLQGNAAMAMIGITSGALLNVALDPILIFGFNMGTEGASFATMISQVIGFSILLHMTTKRDGIPPRFKNFRPTWQQYKEIISNGLPSLGRQGMASIAVACLNHAAGVYGDAAIAAFSIVNRVMILTTSIVIGWGHGFQPVCGFNFGAGRFDRVRQAVKFYLTVSTCYAVCVSVVCWRFAPQIIAIFRSEPELIKIGSTAMRNQCLAYPLVGCIMTANMFLQNIGETFKASIVATARQGLAYLPVLFIAKTFFGLSGLVATQSCSDVLTFLIALPCLLLGLHDMEHNARRFVEY